MTILIQRRGLFVGIAALLGGMLAGAVGCKREPRCKHCGMRIDPASAWLVELASSDGNVTLFDTPRCAFQSWRSGTTAGATLRVRDYYDHVPRDGRDVRFVIGGDILGPMGPDLVPVDPGRVAKFIQDHHADRALGLDEVTLSELNSIGLKD